MAADGAEGYPSTEDRIVAEFGDGYDVEGIASRYGLTVAQVYAVVEREVGAADQGHPGPPSPYPATPGYYAPPPPAYAPPGYTASPYAEQGQSWQPSQGLPDDVVVAEYGEGHNVEAIARKHGISVERVYEVVQRVVQDDSQPPADPSSSR